MNCPDCKSEHNYEDGVLTICAECAHEWSAEIEDTYEEKITRDCNGVELKSGDTVSVIKDLKIRGGSGAVKVGTKVKNIHIIEGDHDIDCKIEGLGAMQLKSQFVKKI